MHQAWVTYFKGAPTGMNHVMMVSNLIRSAQMFSKYPLICVVFGQVEVSVDWDPALFPNLIVIHAGDIVEMGMGMSFNFNKFRSLILRVRVSGSMHTGPSTHHPGVRAGNGGTPSARQQSPPPGWLVGWHTTSSADTLAHPSHPSHPSHPPPDRCTLGP